MIKNSSLAFIMLEMVMENKDLTTLIAHSGKIDILVNFNRKYFNQIIKYLELDIDLSPIEIEYFINMSATTIVGFISILDKAKQIPSTEELYLTMKKMHKIMDNIL